jgi:hypothetical protein
MKSMTALVAAAVTVSLMMPSATFAATAKKKDVRATMSAEKKKELRRKAREWCARKFRDGSNYVDRVEIRRDGSIMCYVRGY